MLRTIPNGALLSTAEAMVISSKIPANHVVSDVGDAANLRLSFNTNDRAFFEFGFNIQAVEGTKWIIERSSVLTSGSWGQAYFLQDPDCGETTTF